MADTPLPRKRKANLAAFKHKEFAKELVANGFDPQSAYKSVYPEAGKRTIQVNSSKLLQTEIVRKEIEKQASQYTPDFIVGSIGEIAREGKKEDTRLRAWELLAKVRSLFKFEAPQQNINVLAQFDNDRSRAGILGTSDNHSIIGRNDIDIDTTKYTYPIDSKEVKPL